MVSFGLGQAPVHPQLMELLLPIQKLLANLLFHRFNLMGKMRGTAVLQAHTIREAQVLPSQGGIQDDMQLVQGGGRASIWIVQQEDYRQEEKGKSMFVPVLLPAVVVTAYPGCFA